jgi:cytosine/adenosine deaminase-related metal-dependent hydrolase
MCILCARGKPQNHSASRRNFLKASAATGFAATGVNLLSQPAEARRGGDDPPRGSGRHGRRYIIRGGHVMSMDPAVGDFPKADVLVDGKKIVAVRPNILAGGAAEIDARGKIVMPGFIDTHHHQFETALRSFLADGLLFNDGKPHGAINYFQYILGTFAPVYRPWDVYINELFGGLSQLDAGVTTCHDISQIHHTSQHSDAAIKALFDTGRRAAFGYFESASIDLQGQPGNEYPQDAFRIRKKYFSSDHQLVTMTMGGEIYLLPQPEIYSQSWRIGRKLELQVVAHIVGSFGMGPEFDKIAMGMGGVEQNIGFGSDNLFIHMTGMSDMSWERARDAGARVSLAVPIEMNMRHGMPPILKTLAMGLEPSLSVDVECTLTADMFTQMRTTMALQRAFVNQMALEMGNPPDLPELLTTRDVLRFATVQGAKDLRLDHKVGTLTPGKEADIILLDAEAINVAPLNVVPGAVVSLMERSNVDTVIVGGKIRKWKGRLLDVDLGKLRRELEKSRDYLFDAAGIEQDLFRPN